MTTTWGAASILKKSAAASRHCDVVSIQHYRVAGPLPPLRFSASSRHVGAPSASNVAGVVGRSSHIGEELEAMTVNQFEVARVFKDLIAERDGLKATNAELLDKLKRIHARCNDIDYAGNIVDSIRNWSKLAIAKATE